MKLELASGDQLLLEDIDQGRIFGVPGVLSQEFPSIGELLIESIVRPALMPVLEKASPAKLITPAVTPISQLVLLPVGSTELDISEPKVKVKTRPTILEGIISQPNVPEEVADLKPKLILINYQVSQLKKMLGRNASDDDINRIQKALYKVEIGEKGVEKLVDLADCYKLRVGRWRIFLRKTSGTVLDVIDGSRRAKAYPMDHIQHFRSK